jgi:hypothetical protein
MADGDGSSWGVSHLGAMPITLTFGMVLLIVLIVLVLLRVLFGSISVSGGVK